MLFSVAVSCFLAATSFRVDIRSHIVQQRADEVGEQGASCSSKLGNLVVCLRQSVCLFAVLKVVVYGCQNLMYCGRALEVSSDGTTWSTVYEANTAYAVQLQPNVAKFTCGTSLV